MKDTLDSLKMGERAIVKEINTELTMKRRLLDIGLTENSSVECVLQSPMGDPMAYWIRGALIAIREEDTKNIVIEK